MKKILFIALSAAFLTAPLVACDSMKDGSTHKSDLKASVSPAPKAKQAKVKSKASKPVATLPGNDQKI